MNAIPLTSHKIQSDSRFYDDSGKGKSKQDLLYPGKGSFSSMTSDGKRIVLSQGESKSDIWLAENFDPNDRCRLSVASGV